MDDLHGTGPRPALDLVQTNLSQKIRFKIWTVCEVAMKYEHHKRERVFKMTRLRSHPTQNTVRGSLPFFFAFSIVPFFHLIFSFFTFFSVFNFLIVSFFNFCLFLTFFLFWIFFLIKNIFQFFHFSFFFSFFFFLFFIFSFFLFLLLFPLSSFLLSLLPSSCPPASKMRTLQSTSTVLRTLEDWWTFLLTMRRLRRRRRPS